MRQPFLARKCSTYDGMMVRPASPTTLDVNGHIVRLFPLELIVGQFEVLVVLLVVDGVSVERRRVRMSV